MPKTCAVPECKTGHKSSKQKCSVFKVPQNPERYEKWLAAISGLAPDVILKRSQFICEKHFEEKYILSEWIKEDSTGQIIAKVSYSSPRLDDAAVPTIFHDYDDRREWQHSFDNQTTDRAMQSVEDSPNVLTTQRGSNETPLPDVISGESAGTISPPCQFLKHEITLPEEFTMSQILSSEEFVQREIVSPEEFILPEIVSPQEFSESKMDLSRESTQRQFISHIETTDIQSADDKSLIAPPVRKVTDKNFNVSNIIINDCVSDTTLSEKDSAVIPKPWGVTEISDQRGQKIVFSHLVRKHENGVQVPVLEKSIMIDTDRTINYYVYGRRIDAKKFQFLANLKSTQLLAPILSRFKNTNVCNGIGNVSVNHLPIESVFKDYVERWRDNECMMLSKWKRCDRCVIMRRRILKRQKRQEQPKNRISRVSNPLDQQKLNELQKRISCERRAKNRAKRRVELLTELLKNNKSD